MGRIVKGTRGHPTKTYCRFIEDDLIAELTRRRIALLKEYGGIHHNPYTLSGLSEKLGISKVCLWKWEMGENTPYCFALWDRWARALGMTFEVGLGDGLRARTQDACANLRGEARRAVSQN
jgi:hypothetical protein